MTALERVMAKVVKTKDGCWIFQGTPSNRYPTISINGERWLVHRLSYTLHIGPVPEGLTLDHLCRHQFCCNPAHLEPVTRKENVLRGIGVTAVNKRKKLCVNGHPLDDAIITLKGRACKTCNRQQAKEYQRRRRARNDLKRELLGE